MRSTGQFFAESLEGFACASCGGTCGQASFKTSPDYQIGGPVPVSQLPANDRLRLMTEKLRELDSIKSQLAPADYTRIIADIYKAHGFTMQSNAVPLTIASQPQSGLDKAETYIKRGLDLLNLAEDARKRFIGLDPAATAAPKKQTNLWPWLLLAAVGFAAWKGGRR